MRSLLLAICVFGASLLVVSRLLPSPPVGEKKGRIPVDTSTLNTTHKLIGYFGKPLGEVFMVTAKIEELDDKDGTLVATVTSVNGVVLRTSERMPVRLFQWANIGELKPGPERTFRVYQDGGMVGIPHQAMAETTIVQTTSHHFETWLVIINEIRVSK